MSSFETLAKAESPAELSRRRTHYTRLMICLGLCAGGLYGYTLTALSGALITMNIGSGQLGRPTDFEQGLITSAMLLSAAVGAFAGGNLNNRLGPKKMILTGAVLAIPGAVICAVTPSILILCLGRVILGLAIGFTSTIVPIYLGEMSGAANRGRIVSVNSVMIVVGQLLAVSVNAILTQMGIGWRAMLWAAVVPGILLLLIALVIKDSPDYLIRHGLQDQAVQLLTETRDLPEAEQTFKSLSQARENSSQTAARNNSDSSFTTPWLRRVLIVGIGLALINQLSGQNMVNYYAPTIFTKTLGFAPSMSILATVPVILVSAIAATIGGLGFIDKINRRTILTVGLVGTIIFLVAIGISYRFIDPSSSSRAASWVMIAMMMIYLVFVQGMVAPVTWLLMAEVFPTSVRGKGMGYANIALNLANFLLSLIFPLLLNGLGGSGTYLLFALINIGCLVFAITMIPETRGKSLEEIEAEERALGQRKSKN